MTTKLVRWSWVLALPLSAVLAAPAERAVEVPLNSTSRIATKSTTATKSGTTVTRSATTTRQSTTVRDRNLSMRDTAPAGPIDDGVSHSIHDWVPRTPTKTSHAQTQSTVSGRTQRAHWWSRPHRVAASQQAEEVRH